MSGVRVSVYTVWHQNGAAEHHPRIVISSEQSHLHGGHSSGKQVVFV